MYLALFRLKKKKLLLKKSRQQICTFECILTVFLGGKHFFPRHWSCCCFFASRKKKCWPHFWMDTLHAQLHMDNTHTSGRYNAGQSWALEVFLNLFNNKKLFFCIFYQVNNLFLHQSYLKSPLPDKIKFIKNVKNHFLLVKKLKNTESAHLWTTRTQAEGTMQGRRKLGKRAGHLRYFFYFFNNKKWFLAFFINLILSGSGLFK